MAENPTRFCPLCKVADTDPRHVIWGDDPNVARHMSCCRTAGCPDGTCDIVTAGAEKKTGEALRKHLTSLDPDEIQKKLDARPFEVAHFTSDAAPTELRGVVDQ